MIETQTIATIGFLLAAVCGTLAVKRTGNWSHFGYWCGWSSVFMLAWLALPSPERQPMARYVRTPQEQQIFDRVEKRYFEKIKKEHGNDNRIAASVSP